jgi:hypothetical protein
VNLHIKKLYRYIYAKISHILEWRGYLEVHARLHLAKPRPKKTTQKKEVSFIYPNPKFISSTEIMRKFQHT